MSHHAYIGHEVSAPLLPGCVENARAHTVEIGRRPHGEYLAGGHATALDGDAAVGVIGSDRHIGGLERQPFQQQQTAPQITAAAEFCLEQLWTEIVMIEQE